MRNAMIAIAALLISPLLIAQDQQVAGTQIVRDDNVSLGLVSDPQGVDFRPYLTGILSTLKANVRGSGGSQRIVIEGAILHNGSLARLVFISRSGSDTLDRAAVTILSSANPFPPLSKDFKGDRIILQFTFAANTR